MYSTGSAVRLAVAQSLGKTHANYVVHIDLRLAITFHPLLGCYYYIAATSTIDKLTEKKLGQRVTIIA